MGPVLLPAHLDRPQIVTRASENRLVLAEFHKWGEPLNTNFARVLAEDLAVLLATERVAVFPWRRAVPVDYQLEVRVASELLKLRAVDLEGNELGSAFLSLREAPQPDSAGTAPPLRWELPRSP